MRYTNQLRIAPADRLSLLQSPAFSGGISSLFGALLNGASVHPIDFRAEGLGALGRWLEREQVTIYHSVPAIFRALVAACRPLPSVRVVRLEGDQASPVDAELFKRRFEAGSLLANGLGATECGLVRQLFLDHDTEVTTSTLPVGYPVEGTEVLVLGDDDREAAPGEIGRIVVRSRFLSPGYWRRPELTAVAFEECPSERGLRVYRTGDLGRMAADGCLEHLGRSDAQAKVRGERVEIEALEAALVSSPLVRDAAAATCDGPDGSARLVAFLVPARGANPTPGELRGELARALPSTSIPSEY
jgi:non-ribosomal peptide synthetase component F